MSNTDNTKLSLASADVAGERLDRLRELFPEAFSEGKADLNKLRLLLADGVEDGRERYELTWAGKSDALRTIKVPSVGMLAPVPKESVNFDTSENLIIEGDNLEVLKLLQKSYHGKVKMIYIDPPYNTGSELIYPDNFREGLRNYLLYTGQVDDNGNELSTKTEYAGRVHSKWLTMMYPRLFVSRNLLKEDGVIFVSIDDNELHNLLCVMNEVFGEENFIGTFVWKRRASSALAERLVSTDHEYVVCYQKHDFTALGIPKKYESYSNPDNDPRGDWTTGDLTVGMGKELRPNQFYDLVDPRTGNSYPANPNRVWAYIKESMQRLLDDNRVIFPQDTKRRPMLKRFKNELKSDVNPASTWLQEVGLNSEATRHMQDLMGENVFSYSKPITLINELISISTKDDDIILDFFAGSGTTAHAAMKLNAEDGGKRKFILVQLPEPTNNNDYPTIAHICRERVRRAAKAISLECDVKLDLKGTGKQDRGFRSFKLTSSCFKIWSAEDAPKDAAGLARQLSLYADHVLPERTQEEVLYELLLKAGMPLTSKIEKITVAGQQVFSIAGGLLLICLESPVTPECLRGMAELEPAPARVICLDPAFQGNDKLKTNTVLEMRSHGIEFRTV